MTNDARQSQPDPRYYLNNFLQLVSWVHNLYSDLLTDSELEFIEKFRSLSTDAQCLMVRLLSRKGPFFLQQKLKYSEILHLSKAISELHQMEFIKLNGSLSRDSLLQLLTKPQLLSLFLNSGLVNKTQKKSEIVQALEQELATEFLWQDEHIESLGNVIEVFHQNTLAILMLLFFGNPYQDLTEFVLADLGLFRYESYTIDKQHRVFNHRVHVNQYLLIIKLRDQLQAAQSSKELLQIISDIPVHCDHPAMERRRAKLCNQLAYELERQGNYDTALGLYQESTLPPSRERQIRILQKQGKFHAAWQRLDELLLTPQSDHEYQVAQRMAPKLAKMVQQNWTREQPVVIPKQELKLQQLLDDNQHPLRVEEITRQAFHQDQSPCLYVENHLFNSLFGLWLWQEIFRDLSGAFANPFQGVPLDMYQEDFVSHRPGIEELWQGFNDGSYKTLIRNNWLNKQGIFCHFVNWELMTSELLELALLCIPANDLMAIFKRLIFDIKANRSGFPDLIRFLPGQVPQYCLIEVKGPGDRVQDNQYRWMQYFVQHQIPVEVCHVQWRN